MSPSDQTPDRFGVVRLRIYASAFVIVATSVVAYGIGSRQAEDSLWRDQTEAQSVPNVAIVAPQPVAHEGGLDLPGRLQAYISAPIYARVPGYLKSWKYDIGSRVKAGDLLAQIDTPDLDQQLQQARADLGVAQANARLAKITADRWQSLAGTDAVAKQDVDTRTFTLNANLAQVKAAQANVDRLVAEEDFKRLVAPFDGIVTARETDIGDLINVGSSGGAQLFVVSATNKLRIYVNVPQNDVPSVPPGTHATITVPEHPEKTFGATVEASAQSVDPTTGTTLMQLIVDNSAGELMPGDYASIHLHVAPANLLSVPSSALIFDSRGLSVATVVAGNRVLVKPVSVARDLGTAVELASGVTPGDRVIENPPDGISNGVVVRVGDAGPTSAAATKRNNGNEKG